MLLRPQGNPSLSSWPASAGLRARAVELLVRGDLSYVGRARRASALRAWRRFIDEGRVEEDLNLRMIAQQLRRILSVCLVSWLSATVILKRAMVRSLLFSLS